MRRLHRWTALCLGVLLLPLWLTVRAEAADDELWENISDPGLAILVAAATAAPLVPDGGDGREAALRTIDAAACAYLLSAGVKRLTGVPRPDGSGDDSFPSNHAAIAFAAATQAADRDPDRAALWYGAAGLIAYSRVRLDEHRPREAIGGALLGFLAARLEQELPRGILILPFVDDSGGCGLRAMCEF